MLYCIVGALVVALDQAVKYWVANTLFGTDIVKFIPGVISLVNVHNDGAAFSFLSGGNARIYFIIITVVFVILVILALATNFISGKLSRWCLVMIAAGGVGNLIDRVMFGYVQDMFKVELFDFAVFNVADAFITVFAIIFVFAMIFEPQPSDEEFEDDDEDEEEKPVKEKKSLFSRNRAEKDFDDEEEEQPRPAHKARRGKYEKEYEQYKAERAAKEKAEKPAKPVRENRATAVDNPADPFAEWERANAKVEAERGTNYASRAMGVSAASRPKPDAAPEEAPVRKAADKPVRVNPRPAPGQSAPAAKQAEPEKKRPVKQAGDDFDLDDILAEFK